MNMNLTPYLESGTKESQFVDQMKFQCKYFLTGGQTPSRDSLPQCRLLGPVPNQHRRPGKEPASISWHHLPLHRRQNRRDLPTKA